MAIFNSNHFIFCFIISYHLILYRIAEGAFPEKECTEQGGECQEKSSCSGHTRDGLCPRQSASIKYFLHYSTACLKRLHSIENKGAALRHLQETEI